MIRVLSFLRKIWVIEFIMVIVLIYSILLKHYFTIRVLTAISVSSVDALTAFKPTYDFKCPSFTLVKKVI